MRNFCVRSAKKILTHAKRKSPIRTGADADILGRKDKIEGMLDPFHGGGAVSTLLTYDDWELADTGAAIAW